jgi:hypothetical protein
LLALELGVVASVGVAGVVGSAASEGAAVVVLAA